MAAVSANEPPLERRNTPAETGGVPFNLLLVSVAVVMTGVLVLVGWLVDDSGLGSARFTNANETCPLTYGF
jgi:hypothetical protein